MATSASAQRKRDMRKSLIEHLARYEGEMPQRRKWVDILPQDPPPPGFTASMFKPSRKGNLLWQIFTTEELDEIQEKAVKRKIARMGDKAAHVLEKLYEHALDGDTAAAREFLTRVLGSPTQKVQQSIEAGEGLQSLLTKLTAADAYKKPAVDEQGYEIIDISPEEKGLPDLIQQEDSNGSDEQPEEDEQLEDDYSEEGIDTPQEDPAGNQQEDPARSEEGAEERGWIPPKVAED